MASEGLGGCLLGSSAAGSSKKRSVWQRQKPFFDLPQEVAKQIALVMNPR